MRFYSGGGPSCNFRLQSAKDPPTQTTNCDPDGESEDGFICRMTDLQPGTLYSLTLVSEKDGERSNASVRTGEFP